MNMPIYMDWSWSSRRCYSRILIVYATIVILVVIAYVIRLLDFLTLVYAGLLLAAIVLVTTAYMIRRNPPLEISDVDAR